MTAEELIRMLRLLAGLEAVLASEQSPDYLMEELLQMSQVIEREILKGR